MKSITLAIVLASLATYGPNYTPPAVPANAPAFSTFSADTPPISSDPDDDEEDHIMHRFLSRRKR